VPVPRSRVVCSASFSLAETERSVHNDHYESVEDFIAKMDSGGTGPQFFRRAYETIQGTIEALGSSAHRARRESQSISLTPPRVCPFFDSHQSQSRHIPQSIRCSRAGRGKAPCCASQWAPSDGRSAKARQGVNYGRPVIPV